MWEKRMSLKSACETLGISRSGQYRKGSHRQNSNRDEVLVGRLKEIRILHPFSGYRQMTAWPNHREGLEVNRKRVYGLMRENSLVIEQARHRALRSSQRRETEGNSP